ncbi:hypothetical protein ACH5RR_022867 [Cinchona calisaya]|uniref:Uncharacterized protein n=1 Tax=Cinchona calisaya TaxID=153742 RepID=A0ABD2ZCB4_9GENT
MSTMALTEKLGLPTMVEVLELIIFSSTMMLKGQSLCMEFISIICSIFPLIDTFTFYIPPASLEEAIQYVKMVGRLSHLASRIMGRNGVAARSVGSSPLLCDSMGLPVGKHIIPNKPLSVNDELVWDNNGTPFPEP